MLTFTSVPSPSCRRLAALALATSSLAAVPAHAVTFTESGDAGQTVATAQGTGGNTGALTDIFGSLAASTDADLYIINITNPGAFSATTVNATGGTRDTQLFLLTMAGAPVEFNDDDAGGLSLLSTLPAGSTGNSYAPVTAGLYLLGISFSGYNPVNINNQMLFAMGLGTSVQGPNTGLQPGVLGGFSDGTYYADNGAYDIKLTGAVGAVPEPTTTLMFLMAGALGVAAGGLRGRRAATAGSAAAVGA